MKVIQAHISREVLTTLSADSAAYSVYMEEVSGQRSSVVMAAVRHSECEHDHDGDGLDIYGTSRARQ